MKFVSYAQNFEDVMLWRALKHIENGFYIDIGAQDPVVDSVSLAFYEHGWRGVHIEPTDYYSKELKKHRADEVVKQVAISCSDESLEFYEFLGTGLSTADKVIAEQHGNEGFESIKKEVEAITLDSLLNSYAKNEIHWLKIDVEGFEQQVIESWVLSQVRPWILVIESTQPLTSIETHSDWEYLIFKKGYSFVYFDGLNRFYVHQDHLTLAKSFNKPPNIFDGFMLSGTSSQPFYHLIKEKAEEQTLKLEKIIHQLEEDKKYLEENKQQVEEKLKKAESDNQKAKEQAQQALLRCQQVEVELEKVYSSHSWRITAFLRYAMYFLRTVRTGVNAWLRFKPGSRPRRYAYATARKCYHQMKKIQWIRKSLLKLHNFNPHVHGWLKRKFDSSVNFSNASSIENSEGCFDCLDGNAPLTHAGQKYYQQLVSTFGNKE